MPLCDRGSGFGDSHFGLVFNVFVEPELSATFSRACSTFNIIEKFTIIYV